MTTPDPPGISITTDDAHSPAVEEHLAAQRWAAERFSSPTPPTSQSEGPAERRADKAARRLALPAVLLMPLAAALGALAGWALVEPFYGEATLGPRWARWALFPAVCTLAGLGLAVAEGLATGSRRRAGLCAAACLGITLPASVGLDRLTDRLVYEPLLRAYVVPLLAEPGHSTAALFLSQMLVRALAWAAAPFAVGLGHGVALRSRRAVTNGLIGGLLGGLVGGVLFDPVASLGDWLSPRLGLGPAGGEAWLSRAVGFTMIGAATGLMIAIVAELRKEAWLRVLAGPLAGKEFVIYRQPTYLGSSPKCDLHLPKDPGVAPQHVAIHQLPGQRAYEIESLAGGSGVHVNGQALAGRQRLRDGDEIVIGQTVLAYGERRLARRAGSSP